MPIPNKRSDGRAGDRTCSLALAMYLVAAIAWCCAFVKQHQADYRNFSPKRAYDLIESELEWDYQLWQARLANPPTRDSR